MEVFMPIPNRIERTIELAHPPMQEWDALTSAEGLGGWFGDRATVDLRPGGLAHVEWDLDDNSHKATLTIAVVEPPNRFAWSWSIQGLPDADPRRTYVEFTLVPNGAGTRLTVVECGFAQVPDGLLETAYQGNVEGWRRKAGSREGPTAGATNWPTWSAIWVPRGDPEAAARAVFAALAEPTRRS